MVSLSTCPTCLLPTVRLSYTHNSLVHTGSSTPISPVVMGFSIQRGDPTAMLSVKQKQKAVVERQRGCVSSVGVTDGLRGSTAGLFEGRRGSVLCMHPTVTPSVHIVNPTLTTATAPSPPSMTVCSGVTHRPNNSQRSSPLIQQSSVSASNSAPKTTSPTAFANAAGVVATAASGSTMSGQGSVGNTPRAAAGPG